MRLLEIQPSGDLVLTEFFGSATPPYAILSHTWGPASDEVSFKDFHDGTAKTKSGYEKITFCQTRTQADGLRHFWIDTCCIDKTSSAELTEAINSMFRWYRDAEKCHVYLSDVQNVDGLEKSRWFTRGWTLQELLAPKVVEFFTREGVLLGDKRTLEGEIHAITGVDVRALRGEKGLGVFSVREKMGWARRRVTTREEDEAYCLLGIFDVHMPLIYGEGRNAFTRLGEEIAKVERGRENALNDAAIPPVTSVNTLRSFEPKTVPNVGPSREEIIKWLEPHDPHSNHLVAQRKRQANTGSWFFQGKQYRDWHHGKIPLLWISGSPGFGKTVLCSTIIQELLESRKTDGSTMMAYYYFDFSESNKRNLDSFLRSLIGQLTENLSELPQKVSDLYAQTRETKSELSIENLKEVLQDILTQGRKASVVVDALDECATPEELVEVIGEMRSWKNTKLQLIVVSRRHFEGVDELEELGPVHVSIQDDTTNTDIATFVEATLEKDVKLKKWPQDVKNGIKTALVSKSNGMFRWVACQTDVLRKCRTQYDIDNVLATLPRTLEETYDRILDSISETCRTEVRAVLQWLTFASRPMRLEEIAEIVAFDESHTSFDVKRRLLNPSEILAMCSSLLVVNKTYHYKNSFYGRIPATEVRLAHFSVKDYLLSPSLQHSRHSHYHLSSQPSNLQIAKACLTYLTMPALACGYRGRKHQDLLLKDWPLLDYAAHSCAAHLLPTESKLDAQTQDLLQTLLQSHTRPHGGNFGALVGTMWYAATPDLIQTTKPLYFAASTGLVSVMQLLLAGGGGTGEVDLEVKGGRFGSPALQVAAYNGRTECVRLLLKAGADPNSRNMLGETALGWAKDRRYKEIERLLVEFGAKR